MQKVSITLLVGDQQVFGRFERFAVDVCKMFSFCPLFFFAVKACRAADLAHASLQTSMQTCCSARRRLRDERAADLALIYKLAMKA